MDCGKFNNWISRLIGFVLRSNRAACIQQIKQLGVAGHAENMAQNRRQTIKDNICAAVLFDRAIHSKEGESMIQAFGTSWPWVCLSWCTSAETAPVTLSVTNAADFKNAFEIVNGDWTATDHGVIG